MISECLRQLLERKLISVKEIEEATGRGNSTVYRWLEKKSQPDINDFISMIQRIESRPVRSALIDAIITDLPVLVHWVENESDNMYTLSPTSFAADARTNLVQAMQTLLSMLATLQNISPNERISSHDSTDMSDKLNKLMHQLSVMKQGLARHAGKRRKARPLQYAH
ncbi:hypothetical protein [Poriferisphaera sp. WC338]|uniref:hypothetical protein n=1 Tax=Poriferisphaera sp. WC338 TaxID=3425129 RepID=UPI003D8152F0